jgi:hypothetical protein
MVRGSWMRATQDVFEEFPRRVMSMHAAAPGRSMGFWRDEARLGCVLSDVDDCGDHDAGLGLRLGRSSPHCTTRVWSIVPRWVACVRCESAALHHSS